MHGCKVGDTAVQALALHDTELYFRDVEPTAVLGVVMDIEPVGQSPGLGGFEGGVERSDFFQYLLR